MKFNSIRKWSPILPTIVILSACTTNQRATTAQVATRGSGTVAEATGPTNAEILHVIRTVNDSEIEAAQLAKSKSQDKQVIELADHIIRDHSANNQQAQALAQRLRVDPDGNEISKSLKAGASATMASLKKAEGSDFDRDYKVQQIKMHQSVLETLDNHLIPNASNPELKSFLETTRQSIVMHLDHAQDLNTLSGSSTQ